MNASATGDLLPDEIFDVPLPASATTWPLTTGDVRHAGWAVMELVKKKCPVYVQGLRLLVMGMFDGLLGPQHRSMLKDARVDVRPAALHHTAYLVAVGCLRSAAEREDYLDIVARAKDDVMETMQASFLRTIGRTDAELMEESDEQCWYRL